MLWSARLTTKARTLWVLEIMRGLLLMEQLLELECQRSELIYVMAQILDTVQESLGQSDRLTLHLHQLWKWTVSTSFRKKRLTSLYRPHLEGMLSNSQRGLLKIEASCCYNWGDCSTQEINPSQECLCSLAKKKMEKEIKRMQEYRWMYGNWERPRPREGRIQEIKLHKFR